MFLSGKAKCLALKDSRRGDGRETHAVADEQDHVLGFGCGCLASLNTLERLDIRRIMQWLFEIREASTAEKEETNQKRLLHYADSRVLDAVLIVTNSSAEVG